MRRWWRKYLEQLPGVAGSLTTAAILFGAAWVFQPTIQQFFATPATAYPISCSADHVSVDEASERATASFFIVNRGDEALTKAKLQAVLSADLGREVGSAGASIKLRRATYLDGRFISARPNPHFNDGKGQLNVAVSDDAITIVIEKIEAHAILEVEVVWSQSPPPEFTSREAKVALPFADREYEQSCYSG